MLAFPLLWSMPEDVQRNDLLHYESVTHPNGPAMTWGVFSTGWLDLGQFDEADRLFDKAYKSYVREPFKVSQTFTIIRRNAFRTIGIGFIVFVRSTRNQLLEYPENHLT